MNKDKNKKIPIEEFVSEKKLNKILDIIKKSDDVEMNYDRIEMILDDDFEVKDLGTNRIVFIHKKKKYDNYIFKVAGDPHGIEANYREFYNGDLDKHLTFSYSISRNGVFVVQERVTRMTKELMKKYKKDVKEMLESLSKKILLVDCKLTNFKNFGIRKNGKVCLLDHGDTVPLPKYQGNEIINVEEESYVSLKCKRMYEASADSKHLKPCGGKLKYSKNYDSLICSTCGGVSAINDAYREFYGDKRIGSFKGSILELEKGFDPDEWKSHIEQYCIETMSHANINNNEGDQTMKTKTINGQETYQIKGFWLPKPENAIMTQMYNSVRMGQTKPKDYLEALKVDNINDYKVMPIDHEIKSNEEKSTNPFAIAANKLIEAASAKGEFENIITYIEAAKICDNIDFGNTKNIGIIRSIMSEDRRTAGVIYNETGFSIRVKSAWQNNKVCEEKDINSTKTIPLVSEDYIENKIHHEEEIKDEDSRFNELESSYIEDYALKNNSKNIQDLDDTDECKGLVLSSDDIENASIEFNGEECVVIGKYAVPMSIIMQYCNENTGLYELPNKKMKLFIKSHNMSPKKYKLSSAHETEEEISENNSETMQEICTEDVNIFNINNEISVKTISDAANQLAKNSEIKDRIGYCFVSPVDLVVEIFLNTGIMTEPDKYFSTNDADDDNIEISVNEKQIEAIYNLFCEIYSKYGTDMIESSPCIDHVNHTLGFLLSEFRNDSYTYDESYKSDKESFIKNSGTVSIPFGLLNNFFTEDSQNLGAIEDFFIEFYNSNSDDDVSKELDDDYYNETYFREYIKLKQLLFSANSYDEFREIAQELGFQYIINIVLEYIVFLTSTDIYDTNEEIFDNAFEDLQDLVESNNINVEPYLPIESDNTEECDDEDLESVESDDDTEINFNDNNNFINKEEISLTNEEIISALKSLVESINENNELLKLSIEQNKSSKDLLDEVNKKLDETLNKDNSYYDPEDSNESDHDEECEKLNYKIEGSIVTMNANDIDDKIFAITYEGKTIAMDLSKLVKETYSNASEDFINVNKFETNAL